MNAVAGLGRLTRLAMRRNRMFWVWWTIGLAVLMPLTVHQYSTLVPPGVDPRVAIEPLANGSMLALLGPAFDLYTKGGFVFWRVGGFASACAAMAGALAVIRVTRAEEEEGRTELLRAGAVGRHAPLAAGLLQGVIGSTVLGVACGALAVASGLPVAGGVAAGLAIGLEALLFSGIGAAVAQVFPSARSVRGATVGLLWGGMFLARMVVDGAGPGVWYEWLRWLVPLEWGMLLRPWAGERWWVAALPLALFGCCAVLAVAGESVRDHQAGLRAARTGRATAPRGLRDTWGLTWRLDRASVAAWTLGIAVAAAGTGSIVAQLGRTLADNPQVADMMRRMGGNVDPVVSFHVAMLSILATLAAVMATVLLLRLRQEEVQGRVELLLSTPVSRPRLAGSHLVVALASSMVALMLAAALLPVAEAQRSGDPHLVPRYLAAGAALLPGLVLVTGVAILLVGWLPRLVALVWVLLGWTLFATWFSVLVHLPVWAQRLQPWGHLPHLPSETMRWTPWCLELAIGLALAVAGLAGYRRRGIPA